MSAPVLASPADKRYELRRLVELLAEQGLPLADVPSPATLAGEHDRLFVTRDHIRVIDDALVWLAATPGGRLMVNIPPQLGKSTLVSRWLPFWWLLQRPMDRIVLTSYASSLAAGHSAACRDLIADFGGEYGLSLSPTESNRTDWTLTTGGGLRARGVRGGLTGNPMDLGIIDDPLADRAQADSPVYRDAVWEWYSSVFLSRMSPGARQVVIMTRWHQDDLSGRLLKRDGRIEAGGLWRVVHLPAIAVKADRERGFYADPLGRAPGDPLPHPKIPAGDRAAAMAFWTRRRADSTSRDWNALYQGVPHDTEGSLLSDLDVLRATVHQVPALRRIAVGVDPSGGGRDEAGLVAGGLGADGRVYLTRNLTARMTSDRWATAACVLAAEVGADRIVVEKNFGGDMARLLILQAWENLVRDGKVAGLPPMVTEVTARRSKVLRAEPIAQAIKGRPDAEEPGRVRFADVHELKGLKAEWTMWTPGSTWSPGALDASVHLVTELLPSLPGGARIESPTGIRRGQARGGGPRIQRRA